MSSTAAATSLPVTVAHAITYLTRSLFKSYSATRITGLQLALESNLTTLFAPTWTQSEPIRGSGRRCLTFCPNASPPRPIHAACEATGIEWSVWSKYLPATEFDLYINPGCISVRFGNWDLGKVGQTFTVWSADVASPVAAKPKVPTLNLAPSKTFAQEVLENEEENELFAMLAAELRKPSYATPILTQFPAVPSSADFSPISRSSSRASSSSSSGHSFSSSPDSADSYSSLASDDGRFNISRRERARQAKVFVDTSKNEVTNYDGGKTTVLTGGVMLGGPAKKSTSSHSPTASITSRHSHSSSSSATSWRSASRV